VNLLLDENISPKVAEALCREDGLDACHVRDRGLLGSTDAEVLERAFVEDRVLVTANVGDFEKLARARELHAGIIFVEQGDLLRDEQLDLVRRVLVVLAGRDIVNHVVRVAKDGTVNLEPMPLGVARP
jgi:predicted nuclease of predicted toxin-antitoxin system